MKSFSIFLLILIWLFVIFSIRASGQDTVKVYVTEWKFIKVTRDTTFTQNKAGLALLETPNNEEWEVVVLYKKKVIAPPVITTVEDKDLTYSAGWESVSGLGWSVSHSSTIGATAKYSFTGNKVEVVADLAPNHGKLGYTINSGTEKVVDLYKATRLNGQTVISELVPAGFNTISFRVISATVLIDKLVITK